MADPATTDSPPKPGKASDNKKLKNTKVKDEISKGRTITGSMPDQIEINPIQEASEKRAVFAFGRFNPPTTGHEKLIHKVESVAKEQGAKAHIIASHSEGTSKNPLPKEKKVEYLKKVAAKDTHVAHSSSEHPTILHHLSNLHKSGIEHVTIVSDKEKEFGDLANRYNGVEGKHGHYNFKTIKSISSGMRDPDAEGAEGISGTKMREHARSGNIEEFKKGLPKSLHKHANEIAKHIKSVKEDLDSLFDDYLNETSSIDSLFDEYFDESLSAATRIRKAASMRRYETKIQAARKRALMRRAGTKGITKRATRLAITKIKTKLAGGRDINTLSTMEKQRVEDLVHKRKNAVRRLAMRLIPQVRKRESARLMAHIHTNEENILENVEFLDEMIDIALEEINRQDTHLRDRGTSSLVSIYKHDTPGEKKLKNKQISEQEDRSALIYMAPQPPKEIFAQCGSCAHFMPEAKRCTLFGKNDEVIAEASCGLYAHGVPSDKQDIIESTTPTEAGYVLGQVRCENCSWYNEGTSTCGLFQELNKKMGDAFKLEESVDKYGCCNGFEREEQNMTESAADKEAIPRSGQPRKSIDYFVRSQVKRTVSDKFYRQQMLQKQKIDEQLAEEKPVWEKEPPKDEPKSKLSPAQKAKAKARAKAAGRPYPNLVDNMWAAKNEEKEEPQGCPLDESYDEEVDGYIEEDFTPTGMELYESWGELTEEAEKNGRRVQLNKPFLTPGGPKKRAVYVRHPETGNVVKVGFGDPNMRIKKNDPERRKSFRARHNCDNPGPRHKARYWSCKAW